MSFNINRGLVEAYQQVHLNEVKVLNEFKTYLLEEFSNQGYELTEEDLEQVLLDEGIASLAMPLLRLFKGAGGVARQAVTNPRMRAAAQRFTQQAGPTVGKVLRGTGKAIGDVYTASKPTVKKVVKAATSPTGLKTIGALSGIEAATSLATGVPSATLSALGSGVGGAGNIVKYGAGKPMSALGFPATEKIGDVIKSVGQGIQDFNQKKGKTTSSTTTPSTQRFEYDAQGRITGFKEDSDVDLENYLVEVLINDGLASDQKESIELLNQVVEYISEAQELVFQNNKPGIMVTKDGKKTWREIDPKKFPNYKEMEASYIRRRGAGQIKQDISIAQQMASAQAKAREDKKKQQQTPKPPDAQQPKTTPDAQQPKPEEQKTTPAAPPAPKPKAPILAKEKGVTGEMDAEGKFKAKEWSAAEKERYETRRGAEQLKKDAETVAKIQSDRTQTETKPEAKVEPTPAKEQPKTLEDLRKASAKATMAGPSKEAQELMSVKTKRLLGKEKLEAGIKAQKEVESMKNKMEEYDAFDNIKDFLIYGGYAQSVSEAMTIMVSMNEEWKNYILELFNE